jgi:signal transduction histidine kinase
VIEAEASRTLAEMRSMVRVLRRNDPAELAPGPRISDLDKLEDLDHDGPFVDVELTGDVDSVPAPVATGVYRLVQESVTNARRHARLATRIEVRVAADDSSVRLRVSDDGETHRTRTGPPSGYGIVGMIERAKLLGGTCEAGPGPDRGWTVTAVLPRTGTP